MNNARLVLLLPVPTAEEERARLRDLQPAASRSPLIVPVLDTLGLPQRIQRILLNYGIPVSPDGAASVRGATAQIPADVGNAPGILITSDGVEEDLALLAAGISGAIRRTFTDAAPLPDLPAGTSALLLLNPGCTGGSEVRDVVAALEACGTRWGIVSVVDPVEARLAILKYLLITDFEASGNFGFVSGTYPVSSSEPSPGWLAQSDSADIIRVLESKSDVLVLGGHANALDARLGETVFLCSKAFQRSGWTGFDLFPCFNDGICRRRPSAGDARKLVGAHRTQSSILVLSGCNMYSLGRSWFRAEAGLAHQAIAADSLAVIASTTSTVSSIELDLLCLALIAEGVPLGEVVSRVNKARSCDTVSSFQVGPFVLLGNPELRARNFPIETWPCTEVDAEGSLGGSVFRITPGPVRSDGNSVLGRAFLPSQQGTPHLILKGPSRGLWCRGIWHDGMPGSRLYLLLHREDAAKDNPSFFVEAPQTSPWEPTRRSAVDFYSELPLWAHFLDSYRAESDRRGRPREDLAHALTNLPSLSRFLAAGNSWLRPRPGELISEEFVLGLRQSVRAEIHRWSSILLAATVDITARLGLPQSFGVEQYLQAGGLSGTTEACLCGEGLLRRRIWESPDGRIRRVEHICEFCDAREDSDGRSLVKITDWPKSARGGERFSVRFTCHAPPSVQVHLHAALVVDPWIGQAIAGAPYCHDLEPGERFDATLHVSLPSELTPGSYRAFVIAVVNGSLYLHGRMIGLLPSSGDVN